MPQETAAHLTKTEQFWWGVLGATAPYVVRAVRAVKPGAALASPGVGWILVSLCAVVFGGFWSIAMKSDPEWKAMYNGATFQIVFAFLAS
jgi:hypothetical protein